MSSRFPLLWTGLGAVLVTSSAAGQSLEVTPIPWVTSNPEVPHVQPDPRTFTVLKAIAISTVYRPTVLSLSSMDFVIIAGICLGFALTLAARTWVRLNEPRLIQLRQRRTRERARHRAGEQELGEGDLTQLHPDEATAGQH